MSSHVESQQGRQPSKVHLCRVVPASNTDDNDKTVGQTWGRVAPNTPTAVPRRYPSQLMDARPSPSAVLPHTRYHAYPVSHSGRQPSKVHPRRVASPRNGRVITRPPPPPRTIVDQGFFIPASPWPSARGTAYLGPWPPAPSALTNNSGCSARPLKAPSTM